MRKGPELRFSVRDESIGLTSVQASRLFSRLRPHEQLKQLGIDVKIVANGKEAAEIVGKEDFDLIFMDCHMPEMDGYDRGADRERDDRGSGRCINSGMDDYMAKPFTREQMADTLRKWIPA